MFGIDASSFYFSDIFTGAGGVVIGFVGEVEMEGFVGLRGGKDMTVVVAGVVVAGTVVVLFKLGFIYGEIGGWIICWTGGETVGLKIVYLGWILLL